MNDYETATFADLPSEWLSASLREKEVVKKLLREMKIRRETKSSEKVEILFDKTGSPCYLGQYVLDPV